MGLKRFWLHTFRKARKAPRARADQEVHPTETLIAPSPLQVDVKPNLEATDEDHAAADNHGPSSLFYLQNTNPALQVGEPLVVGQCPMPLGTPLPEPPMRDIKDTAIDIIPRNQTDPYEPPYASVPSLQLTLPNRRVATPSYQYSPPPIKASGHWRKSFTLKNLSRIVRGTQYHQSTTVDPWLCPNTRATNVDLVPRSLAPILPLKTQQPSQPPNRPPNQPPADELEATEDLSYEMRPELSVTELDDFVVDISNHVLQPRNLQEHNPRISRIDKEQVDQSFHDSKPLPEIPRQISGESVGELEPDEVVLYPRKDELEALRQQFHSPPQVEENNEAQYSFSTLPEMGHGPVVGNLPLRFPSTPELSYLPSPVPSSLASAYATEEDASAVIYATPLELIRRGVPQSLHFDFNSLYNSPSASKVPPLESFFLKLPRELEYSMRDSLFSCLDIYFEDGLTHIRDPRTTWHPWSTRFIGKGASGKVFRVGYKTEIWSPEGKFPGVPPVAFGEESQVACVKVVDMRKQTRGSLRGLVSEVVALNVLRRKRDEVADAKARGKRMRYSDGLYFLLESASLPGIDDTVVLRADRLYLLTKHYYCDLTNYGFKVSNDERSLSFILSELTRGLNYLHHIGIVHLDIKPSNIFITHDRHCVIGDLGSSVYRPGFIMANEAGLPVDVLTSYTDGFCAPEIVLGHYDRDRFDCKADFWSLGVTIYSIVRPDGLLLPNINDYDSEEHWRQRRNFDGMGLDAKYMVRMMYDVGCPGRIANLLLNMCQRDPKKRLGGRGIVKNLKEQGLLSNPWDPSPLPDVFMSPRGLPGPETKGPYRRLGVEDACKTLKEHIESRGYSLTIQG